jgi:hypothetical protein
MELLVRTFQSPLIIEGPRSADRILPRLMGEASLWDL